jgi:hypothetical protein
MLYRCRIGEKNAGRTVATTPLPSSISIVSRSEKNFFRMRI